MFSTKVLVIPGGRDLPYTRDITMSAIDNIREFVDMGGSYLGICAGAYFACSQVEFEKGTSLEVLGYRSLQFFKGIARGSVYNGFKYDSTSGARMVHLQLHHDFNTVNQNSYAYFDGGCEFIPEENFTLHKTVAFYNDFTDKKAIVLTKFGKGKVLLSGVHPEMDANFLKESDYSSSQWIELMKYSHFQKELFCLFINILFDRCNELK
ncbi:uncharacterized protein LOC136071711 isoform X1 [Hydra vulgaris]|uniref:uncharacterized protein LOC136071711 isoform X1 n=1 Tax=Hydra vulgaris TaxID=6087 RepID=UPI0032EA291E